MSPDEIVLRLIFSALLGGIIGLERELSGKAAGVKTQALICLGATTFCVVSLFFPGSDTSRIAAQIVTGIGFLGAGAIIQSSGAVHGLTTAATTWAVAGVGMAVGFGSYVLGSISTFCILLILFGLSKVEEIFNLSRTTIYVDGVALSEEDTVKIKDLVAEMGLKLIQFHIELKEQESQMPYSFHLQIQAKESQFSLFKKRIVTNQIKILSINFLPA